jgi:hypothetical protein
MGCRFRLRGGAATISRAADSLSAASLIRRSARSRAVLAASACFSSSPGSLTFTCTCFIISNGPLAWQRHRSPRGGISSPATKTVIGRVHAFALFSRPADLQGTPRKDPTLIYRSSLSHLRGLRTGHGFSRARSRPPRHFCALRGVAWHRWCGAIRWEAPERQVIDHARSREPASPRCLLPCARSGLLS